MSKHLSLLNRHLIVNPDKNIFLFLNIIIHTHRTVSIRYDENKILKPQLKTTSYLQTFLKHTEMKFQTFSWVFVEKKRQNLDQRT